MIEEGEADHGYAEVRTNTDLGARVMESLEEWNFEFSVAAAGPIPSQLMDDLLWLEAVPWAEERQLGIGGSFRPSQRRAASDRVWHFALGLCAQREGVLVPRSEAQELFDIIAGWCRARGLEVNGGFRAYTSDELGLTD